MDECRITPLELYFLGVLMKAKYLDFQYFKALPNIENNYRVIEQNTLDRLEERNLIEQDFDGSTTVTDDIYDLLKPVFFGLVECRVATTWTEGNLHVHDDNMTLLSKEHDFYLLEKMNEDKLKEMIMDQDVELQSMNIQKGYLDKSFTEDEMSQPEMIDQAISIMKGDW